MTNDEITTADRLDDLEAKMRRYGLTDEELRELRTLRTELGE